MPEPFLSLSGITKHFGGVTALDDISFDVAKGEVIGLMGPNGAGKTTLLNAITGNIPPDSGKIRFKGINITGQPPHKTCQMGIARTYQIPQPFVSLSVLDNLRVAATFGKKPDKKLVRQDFENILEMAGLADRKDQRADTLPTLTLKKLELARALASDPELILLDEIAAGLTDPEIAKTLETIKEITAMGVTIIIIEHVMKVMMNAVDRIVVLDKGARIGIGSTDEVINDPRVMEAYFGT